MKVLCMKVMQHLISALSVTIITLNFLFWFLLLLMVTTIKVLYRAKLEITDSYTEKIYRAAIWFNRVWLIHVLGIKFQLINDSPTLRSQPTIVISNHQSWFDILILQSIIVPDGPILKFLIKKELVYIPIVGWLCFILNFPRLQRGTTKPGLKRDYRSITHATFSLHPGKDALVNFVEGTRLSYAKQLKQHSPYQHLLKPKATGLVITIKNIPQAIILDVTIIYPQQKPTFWQCLSGALMPITIQLSQHAAADITNIEPWLKQRWLIKDQLIHKTIRDE